jgi:NAD(P)H-hydrate epimerase
MIPVLSPDEASELDRASQERGVAASALMARAGREVAGAAARLAGGRYGRRAVVVCGRGNNGGDGFVAARILDAWGMRVTVLALDDAEPKEPAASSLRALAATSVRLRPWSQEAAGRELARADVAIDAVFGTGFHGVPEGPAAEAIRALADAQVPLVSVDIPSGVNGESGQVEGDAVRADLTVTFGAPKVGVVLLPGAAHAGVVEVADIGFPRDLIASALSLVEAEDVASWLPAREPDTHKRASGYAVVVGGSRAMTGALALMAGGAYRAGAGLVAVGAPASILPVVQGLVREAVFAPLPETDAGSVLGGSDRLTEVMGQADAVAIGPGMTTDERTAAWIRELVRSSEIPVVLDADGLGAFAGRADELPDRKSDLVLTPHDGEFVRLAGGSTADLEADRIASVRELSARTGAVVLLKGSRTLVAQPDGGARVNPTGTSFLATGGTGDVLTGMIAGLLARGLAPADAASAAAYVHGIAGALAGERHGEGTTAGDVLQRVPEALLEVTRA